VKSELCILVLFLFLLFLSNSLLDPSHFSLLSRQPGLVPTNTIITADKPHFFLTIYGAFSL
jgi:hypothetical protein